FPTRFQADEGDAMGGGLREPGVEGGAIFFAPIAEIAAFDPLGGFARERVHGDVFRLFEGAHGFALPPRCRCSTSAQMPSARYCAAVPSVTPMRCAISRRDSPWIRPNTTASRQRGESFSRAACRRRNSSRAITIWSGPGVSDAASSTSMSEAASMGMTRASDIDVLDARSEEHTSERQ